MSTTYFFLLFIALVVLATPSFAQSKFTILDEQDEENLLNRPSIFVSTEQVGAPELSHSNAPCPEEELKHKHEHKHKHRKLSPSPAEAPEEHKHKHKHEHKHKHKRSHPPAEAPKSDSEPSFLANFGFNLF
ncbi:hypothetical protein A4A49_38253 [Nicotiana attenuata]|uniref:Uncharacterized protein n=1 Tax=Nicotiana attenuata TaxID=49451 RepID=A0A1J6I2E1_NICAT|nr:hypothetical protein A4A49_38253 [Nicotiana attenuata]